jgi:hypothetical protein
MPEGSVNRAIVLFEAPRGTLWLGSAEGLARVTGGPPAFLSTAQGLPETWGWDRAMRTASAGSGSDSSPASRGWLWMISSQSPMGGRPRSPRSRHSKLDRVLSLIDRTLTQARELVPAANRLTGGSFPTPNGLAGGPWPRNSRSHRAAAAPGIRQVIRRPHPRAPV